MIDNLYLLAPLFIMTVGLIAIAAIFLQDGNTVVLISFFVLAAMIGFYVYLVFTVFDINLLGDVTDKNYTVDTEVLIESTE